jgi:hypothetical protein
VFVASGTVTEPGKYEVSHELEGEHNLHVLSVDEETAGLYTCSVPADDLHESAYVIALGESLRHPLRQCTFTVPPTTR